MGRLDGKIAIVTGAARGSGALTAEHLISEGARVVLADVLDDRGKPVTAKLGEAARYIRAGTPREAKLEAARGELALDLPEWITVLYLLSQEPDDEIRDSARARIRSIPQEKALKAFTAAIAFPSPSGRSR